MYMEQIDRRALKAQTRETLRDAQVSPKAMVALYLGLLLVLDLVSAVTGSGALSTFVSILSTLLSLVLEAGFILYCMAVRRGERAELLTLFDGFSFAGKVICLNLVMYVFIILWSCLLVIPGVIAMYRYRFAVYNLCEDPSLSVFEALNMSKRQTIGYKGQLFLLDLSYLGWGLLASLPAIVYSGLLAQQALQDGLMGDVGVSTIAATTVVSGLVTSFLSVWGWTLLIGLWQLAVAVFYVANYQCVDLGYFETAKRTSGIGAGAPPRQDDPWGRPQGPDDLGGY